MSGKISIVDRFLYFLVHVKGLLTHGFRKTHYSQWGEDIAILSQARKGKGFYIDVGAYHPLHYSNTHLLHRKGWKGINIDPNPDSIALLKLYRPNDTNLNSGIAEQAETKTYYVFNHQSCNTFSSAHKETMLARRFMRLIREIEIPCIPLQSVIDTHAKDIEIDLLNIDVEGMGLSVLRSFDITKVRPHIICIEDDDLDFSKEGFASGIHEYLITHGYALFTRVGHSSLYKDTKTS